MAYPRMAYPRMAYPRMAYPRMAYPRMAYPRMAYPRIAYPRMSYPRQGGGIVMSDKEACRKKAPHPPLTGGWGRFFRLWPRDVSEKAPPPPADRGVGALFRHGLRPTIAWPVREHAFAPKPDVQYKGGG